MIPRPYGPFPYSPIINRPALVWPDNARVAVWIVPNIEFFALTTNPNRRGPVPDVPGWAQRDYGNRVGVFRLMQVLDKHDFRATAALNSDVCRYHPEIIDEGRKRSWEWMGHNETNSIRLTDVAAEEERSLIHNTLTAISKETGATPAGWLSAGMQESWHTLDMLIDLGCRYVADWGLNDDQPYIMELGKNRSIISVPFSYHMNDKYVFEKICGTPASFRDALCRQFDVLYAEGAVSGRVMSIVLHPYIAGLPYIASALDEALAYICTHRHIWKATGSEIAFHDIAPTHAASVDVGGNAARSSRDRPRQASTSQSIGIKVERDGLN